MKDERAMLREAERLLQDYRETLTVRMWHRSCKTNRLKTCVACAADWKRVDKIDAWFDRRSTID